MEMIYYTVAAVALYVVSDWILNQIEIRRGERFENRSLIFFVIILVLAMGLFSIIQRIQSSPPPVVSTPGLEGGQGIADPEP